MPKDKNYIQFVREGETLSRNDFAKLMNRFISESFAPARKREENESELHYIQHVKEPHKANALRADVFSSARTAASISSERVSPANSSPTNGSA